ncbi:MAG: hypothetical protein WAV55_02805 [Clostridiaceae bacterium]
MNEICLDDASIGKSRSTTQKLLKEKSPVVDHCLAFSLLKVIWMVLVLDCF